MSELPKGWAISTLRELSEDISYGFTTSAASENGNPRLLRITDLQDNSVDWEGVPFCSEEPDTKFDLVDGDIVVARTGATTGKNYLISHVPSRTVFASYLIRIRTAEGVKPSYVSQFMKSSTYWAHITKVSKGVAQPGANASVLADLEVPLPPIPEQRRIVRKLDILSTRTTTARTHLTAIAKLVERYKAAILKDIFEQVAIENPVKALSSLCLSITDGDHQAPPKAAAGVPFITISAINTGRIDLTKATRFVPETYYQELKPERRPQIGDVLFSVTGSIGIPAPVMDNEKFVFQRHIAIIRPDANQALQSYLLYALQSPQTRRQSLDWATGIAQLTIPLKGLRVFEIPTPSVGRQREIVRRIETAFAKIDLLAVEAEKALKLTDRLDQRILAKAFAGELVPQDPNDEPASELLARIREARANAPKKPRQKRTKANAMKTAPKDLLLADSTDWPERGLPFEEVAKRVILPHDDLRDALFELLGGAKPRLEQVFDKEEARMRLKRVAR